MPETKGISEKSFWSCADRDTARKYLSSMAEYSTGKAKADAAKDSKTRLGCNLSCGAQCTQVHVPCMVCMVYLRVNIIETSFSLAAAIVGAIPWGSWGASGEASVRETSVQTEETTAETVEERAQQAAEEDQQEARDMATQTDGNMFDVSKAAGVSEKAELTKTIASSVQSILGGASTGLGYYDEFKGPAEDAAEKEESPLKIAKEIQEKTLPHFEARPCSFPQLKDSARLLRRKQAPIYEFDKKLAKASWNDCVPLQFGLSKVLSMELPV